MAEAFELEPLDVRHVARLRELHMEPGVLRWWGPMLDDFPFDEPESTRYAIVVEAEVAGMVQHGEEATPDTRHAYIDIFLGDAYSGRGIGTEVIRRVARMLVTEHGHHHITLDPLADNAAAIRSYEKAGFEAVGVRKRFWHDELRGEWRDELLMQYVTQP